MTTCDELCIGRGVGTSVSGRKNPSRLWLTGAKSLDRICKATAPGVAGLTAAKSGRSSATGAQLRLVRPHHRRGRNHRDAVLLAGGADAVRVRWRQSRALARE